MALPVDRHNRLPESTIAASGYVYERAIGGHGEIAGTVLGRQNPIEHGLRCARYLKPPKIKCDCAQRSQRTVDKMSRRHIVRVAASRNEHLRGSRLQVQDRNLRVLDVSVSSDRKQNGFATRQELGPYVIAVRARSG